MGCRGGFGVLDSPTYACGQTAQQVKSTELDKKHPQCTAKYSLHVRGTVTPAQQGQRTVLNGKAARTEGDGEGLR